MASILTYSGYLAGLKIPQSQTKSATLQTSVSILYDGEIIEYNSTPDYILTENFVGTSLTHVVGEVESSPISQMVVAMLGQVARCESTKIIGLTLSKSLNVRMFVSINESKFWNFLALLSFIR